MAKRFKLRWRENGRHCQRTFQTKVERDDFAARLRLRSEPIPWMTFGEYAERWLKEHSAYTKARTTVKMEEAVIRRHLIPALENFQLRDLKKSTLIALRGKWCVTPKERGGKPLGPKTVNNMVGIAKAMMTTAVDWELVPKNPWLGIKALPLPEQAFKYWTADERDRFLERAAREPEFRDLVLVACHTGLRKGELKALTRAQLDFASGQLRVDSTFCEKLHERMDRAKSGRVDFVPMNDLVLTTLADREPLPHNEAVFHPKLFGDFNGRLERRCKEYGVTVLRPHDLRHTFVSNLVADGVPLYTVKQLARHANLAMTERYAHLAPGHLREAVQRLCARNVRGGGGEVGNLLRFQLVRARSQ